MRTVVYVFALLLNTAVFCADLASILEPIRRANRAPALACAVWRGTSISSIGVTGVRKLDERPRATINDKWHIGSNTKAMTDVLAAIFIEQGKLRFDSTLASLFPDMDIHQGYRNVTINHLMQHRAGLPDEAPDAVIARMKKANNVMEARVIGTSGTLSQKPRFTPGSRYYYSNIGYIIIGAALERIEKRSWEDLLNQHVFNALGMASCGYGAPGNSLLLDQPWGHYYLQVGKIVPLSKDFIDADNPLFDGPAGTVHCSLADWGKFLTSFYSETSLLKPATMAKLLNPTFSGTYAGGWDIITDQSWTDGTALSHDGSISTWYTDAFIAPSKKMAFACATNIGSDGDDDPGSDTTEAAMKALIRRRNEL